MKRQYNSTSIYPSIYKLDLPIYLQGNSLWMSEERDLSAFWRTFEDIDRYMVVMVNYIDSRANYTDVINWKAEGTLKQETVYIPILPGETIQEIQERANALFAARYGEGAFNPEYWFGTVKKGDELWPKIDSTILKDQSNG